MNSCCLTRHVAVTCLTNGKRLPGNQTYFDDEIIPDSCKYEKVDRPIRYMYTQGICGAASFILQTTCNNCQT